MRVCFYLRALFPSSRVPLGVGVCFLTRAFIYLLLFHINVSKAKLRICLFLSNAGEKNLFSQLTTLFSSALDYQNCDLSRN